MSFTQRLVRLAALTALLLGVAGPAAAHVTVQAPGAAKGGFTKLTFRAPTEKDVPTTKLEVAFPEDAPIASVRVKPKAGWTYELTKAPPAKPFEAFGEPVTEVVTRVVWTATAGGIGSTEFDEFEVSAGPLPDTDRLVFKALQTYGDGEVVRWIEEAAEGAEEPEHPAPVLDLADAESDHGQGDAASGGGAEQGEETASGASDDGEDDDDGADPLSIVALALAAVGVALGAAALARSRRTTA